MAFRDLYGCFCLYIVSASTRTASKRRRHEFTLFLWAIYDMLCNMFMYQHSLRTLHLLVLNRTALSCLASEPMKYGMSNELNTSLVGSVREILCRLIARWAGYPCPSNQKILLEATESSSGYIKL